jgi:hypothetical protein
MTRLVEELDQALRHWTESPDRCDMEGREREVAEHLARVVESRLPDHPFRRVYGRSMTPRWGWAVVRELRFAGVAGWLVRWDDEARLAWHREDELVFEDGWSMTPRPTADEVRIELTKLVDEHAPAAKHDAPAAPALVMARPWLAGVELPSQPGVVLGNWGAEYALVWFPGMSEGRLVTGISVQPILLSKLIYQVQT